MQSWRHYEELKKKYNDKLSVIMQTDTDDKYVLEEDENAKAEWNNLNMKRNVI